MAADAPMSRAAMIALAAAGHELTITGVPPGSGMRMGVDRDRDGALDGDELAAGTDPGDPASHPVAGAVTPGIVREGLRAVRPNPFHEGTTLDFALARTAAVTVAVFDVTGRQVRVLARGQRMAPGTQSLRWDGRADDGHPVATGVYFVRLVTPGGEWRRAVIRVR
jgi:hypothetical protein